MSRTYRCRHLPVYTKGEKAFKVVESGRFYYKRREYAEQMTTRFLGPEPTEEQVLVYGSGLTHSEYIPPTYSRIFFCGKARILVIKLEQRLTLPGKYMMTWESWYWNAVERKISDDWVAPVAAYHPWQRRPSVGGRKKYIRVKGNRSSRRYNRQILKSKIIDDDWTGHWMHKREAFDWWDIY